MRAILHGQTGHGESKWVGPAPVGSVVGLVQMLTNPPDDYVAFRACGEVIGFCGGANPSNFIAMVTKRWEEQGAKVERMPIGQGADLFYTWHPECLPRQHRGL